MTKLELVTQLARELDDESDPEIIQLIGDWVNDVIKDLATRFQWQILEVGQELTWPAGTRTMEIKGVRDIAAIQRRDVDTIFVKTTHADLMNRGYDLDLTGYPGYWFIKSGSNGGYVISFDKTPDENLDLYLVVSKEIGDIANDDQLPFSTDMLHLVKHSVRAFFYTHEEQYNSAQIWESRYERGIQFYRNLNNDMSAHRVVSPSNSDLRFSNISYYDDVYMGRRIPWENQ